MIGDGCSGNSGSQAPRWSSIIAENKSDKARKRMSGTEVDALLICKLIVSRRQEDEDEKGE